MPFRSGSAHEVILGPICLEWSAQSRTEKLQQGFRNFREPRKRGGSRSKRILVHLASPHERILATSKCGWLTSMPMPADSRRSIGVVPSLWAVVGDTEV